MGGREVAGFPAARPDRVRRRRYPRAQGVPTAPKTAWGCAWKYAVGRSAPTRAGLPTSPLPFANLAGTPPPYTKGVEVWGVQRGEEKGEGRETVGAFPRTQMRGEGPPPPPVGPHGWTVLRPQWSPSPRYSGEGGGTAWGRRRRSLSALHRAKEDERRSGATSVQTVEVCDCARDRPGTPGCDVCTQTARECVFSNASLAGNKMPRPMELLVGARKVCLV